MTVNPCHHWRNVAHALLLLLSSILLVGCAPSLVEAAVHAAGGNNGGHRFTGNEVIGVWASSSHAQQVTNVVLFRPDGTGRERIIDKATGKVVEWTFAWHYEGSGLWAGKHMQYQEIKPSPSAIRSLGGGSSFTVTLNGGSLRRDYHGESLVFTRS